MRRKIVNIIFALSMVVMALVLTVAATLICTVNLLRPQVLTPVAQSLANKMLDAKVSMSRMELSFNPRFPVLRLEIDSIRVVSKAFDNLSDADRAAMPVWADSLASIDRFGGSINLGALLSRGEIALSNVELLRPAVNIALAPDGTGNFAIYRSAPDTTDTASAAPIPPISVDHFAFVDPHEIRFFNAADSTDASIVLLRQLSLDRTAEPEYTISIDGHLNSPLTKAAINLSDLTFGLGGRMRWDPANPKLITLDSFTVRGAFLNAAVDAGVNLDSTLTVTSARIDVAPMAVTDILSLLPDSIRRAKRLVAPFFKTDGAIAITAELLAPFCPATDSLPRARATLSMADCSLRYGKADLRKLGFEIAAEIPGSNLDSASIDVRRFEAAGPATSLSLAGTATRLVSDPLFDVDVKADVDLRRLPPIVADLARGFISGRLNADVKARGALSMLRQENFHKLDVKGKANLSGLYYLSNDTARMAEVANIGLAFGSQVKLKRDSLPDTEPMLSALIRIDTATVLVDGVNIALSALKLGAGVENMAHSVDTTLVVPLGGGLSIGRLNIESITDTGGVRIRDLAGRVTLHRFKGMKRVPEIAVDLNLGRMAAGTPSSRLILSKAHLNACTHKIPGVVEFERDIRHLKDSISRRHPDLSPDSVMRLALERRRHRKGQPGRRRVYTSTNASDVEVLDWDLSKGFRKFLLGWQLNGRLTTKRARLFTPLFPLRNRINNLDIVFSNDSVRINNLRYRAGKSDIAMSGLISNIKRGLTSKRGNNSLKINFNLISDTIDANQLSAAVFAGAAYAHRVSNGGAAVRFDSDSDDALDSSLDALASEKPDTVAPLLIPTNLDGELILKANKIFYADMTLADLNGDILLYDGGLNVHKLAARSDAGNLSMSALYSAPKASDMHFGFGLDLERFNIERFLTLVPAVDSLLPIMRDFSGIINAEIAATVDIDSTMNLDLPSLDAAVRITGDSLAFIDPKTYATIGKWLRFRDKADNKIKHVNVEMIVRDNMLQIFPFSFDIDRYRLGVAGYNDLDLNFDYHIAVLKSPIPFKFGVTVKGNPDKYKIRLGGAKFKEGQVAESINVVDTARINLLRQIENVFRRGVQRSRFSRINVAAPDVRKSLQETELTPADSAAFIREGLIAPQQSN